MKTFSILLAAAILLSLLTACGSVLTPISDTSENSHLYEEESETPVESELDEQSTTQDAESTSQEATTSTHESKETTTKKTTTTQETTTKKKTTTSEKSSNTKKTTTTTRETTTTNTKETTTTTEKTTTTTKTETTTTESKTDHGTPNISGTYHEDMAEEVLTLLNQARTEAGLDILEMDRGNMMRAAKVRAKEITIDWAHERPDHDKWDSIFKEEGVTDYKAYGENLAKGQETAQLAFNDWMNSAGHKANIMQPLFTHVSIVTFEYDGHFYWVQLFGAKK